MHTYMHNYLICTCIYACTYIRIQFQLFNTFTAQWPGIYKGYISYVNGWAMKNVLFCTCRQAHDCWSHIHSTWCTVRCTWPVVFTICKEHCPSNYTCNMLSVFSYTYNKFQVNIRTLFILFLIGTPKHFSSLSQLGNRTLLYFFPYFCQYVL